MAHLNYYDNAPRYYYKKVEAAPQVFNLDLTSITEITYMPEDAGTSELIDASGPWIIDAEPPEGLAMVTTDLAFDWGGTLHSVRNGAVFADWNPVGGSSTNVGTASSGGQIQINALPSGSSNAVNWINLVQDRASGLEIFGGVFRTAVAPIKAGSFQLQAGADSASANGGGVLSGDFEGLVDFQRGITQWQVAGLDDNNGTPVNADDVTYNAVFLQYVPLDASLLGLSTVRLPLDGKVPVFHKGGQVLVHDTKTTTLPNPVVLNTAYPLGRQRIAAVNVKTTAGVKVGGDKYVMDFNAGEITFPTGTDLTGLDQPFTVEHRIEDQLLTTQVDISGKVSVGSGLTHDYVAGEAYVSSVMRKGDLFARTVHHGERVSWLNAWDATFESSNEPTASLNWIDHPIEVTNRGAIRERWALVFMTPTTVRVFGENVGQVLYDETITGTGYLEAINTQAAGAPYWSIPLQAFGSGWSTGNVILWETYAAGAPAWITRTVLQGPASVESDVATIAFRSDVDQP